MKLKTKIGLFFFYIGLLFELLVMMTDHYASWTLPYRGRITHVAFVMFITKILFTKHSLKEYCIMMFLFLLGAISYFSCGDEYVIRAIVFVIAAKGIDVNYMIKSILICASAGYLLIVLSSVLVGGGHLVDLRDYGRGGIEARYCLGFHHANNAHDMLWYIISLVVLRYKKVIPTLVYFVLMIANGCLYYLTKSRTGFIVVTMLLVGSMILKYASERLITVEYVVGVVLLLSIVSLTLWASKNNITMSVLVAKLDPILNGRLEMLSEHANMSSDGWLLFSNGRSAEYVDNGFSVLFYSYGTVIAVLAIICILFSMRKLYVEHKGIELLVTIIATIVLFMESTFVLNVSILCNMLLIIFVICENLTSRRV